MSNYLSNIRRTIVGLQSNNISPDISLWLQDGFRKHTNTGEPLDECLGLMRGKGKNKINTQVLLEERNRCICGIAKQYDGVSYAKAMFVQQVLKEFYGMSAYDIITRNRELDNPNFNVLVMYYMQTLSHIKYPVPGSLSRILKIIDK